MEIKSHWLLNPLYPSFGHYLMEHQPLFFHNRLINLIPPHPVGLQVEVERRVNSHILRPRVKLQVHSHHSAFARTWTLHESSYSVLKDVSTATSYGNELLRFMSYQWAEKVREDKLVMSFFIVYSETDLQCGCVFL